MNSLIIIGMSNSGKSTIANILADKKLKSIFLENIHEIKIANIDDDDNNSNK